MQYLHLGIILDKKRKNAEKRALLVKMESIFQGCTANLRTIIHLERHYNNVQCIVVKEEENEVWEKYGSINVNLKLACVNFPLTKQK